MGNIEWREREGEGEKKGVCCNVKGKRDINEWEWMLWCEIRKYWWGEIYKEEE